MTLGTGMQRTTRRAFTHPARGDEDLDAVLDVHEKPEKIVVVCCHPGVARGEHELAGEDPPKLIWVHLADASADEESRVDWVLGVHELEVGIEAHIVRQIGLGHTLQHGDSFEKGVDEFAW